MQPDTYMALAKERADRFRAEADNHRWMTGTRTRPIGPTRRLMASLLRFRGAAAQSGIQSSPCPCPGEA